MAWKVSKLILFCVLLAILLLVAFYWRELNGLRPALTDPKDNIVDIIDNNNSEPGQNSTDFPLRLPENFKIEIFAKDLPGARVMVFDGLGNMWISQTNQGKVTQLEIQDGKVGRKNEIFRGLNKPHGLAIDWRTGTTLFIAEEHRVSRVELYSEDTLHELVSLPSDGGHSTRTVEIGPEDERLYVSIGSSCNVCREDDPRRAAIYTMNKDGSDFKEFARGLRNAVFFDWSFVDGSMWATEMGRDNLGDNVPPDEINVIKEGGNYGWPICYGNNIHDTNFDKNTYIRNPCMEPFEIPAKVDLQAHSAPLGLAFVPEEGWPEEYWYDLIVAFHGSWNRTEPTGYKLARVKLDAQGNYQGTEDFITGWLQGNNALGRPVDVLIQSGGVMYVSDDKAGVIYKITYIRE